jgi:5-methylcytosine-specific restriction endonuclease McrA
MVNGHRRKKCYYHHHLKYRSEHPEKYKYNSKQKKWHKVRKLVIIENRCVKCGFVAENLCQLDIDHKDENHENNSLENLQVLCANCHRLKTFIARAHGKTS